MNSSGSELLAIRPRPQPDELLSSWLVRLAHALGIKVETLCADLFGRGHSVWCRDIDSHPPETVVRTLARAAGIPEPVVRGLCLTDLKEDLGASNLNSAFAPWITPLGVYHRSRRRHGLMYCPHCLREEPAYFRRSWRLALISLCTKHRCELLDACPECGEAISPHRTDLHRSGFVPETGACRMCWACGVDLARSASSKADPSLLTFTTEAVNCLRSGFTRRAGNDSLYAGLYFSGLRLLSSAIAGSGHAFEFERVERRRAILTQLASALSGDGDHLVCALRSAGLRHSDLLPSGSTPPFWLADELSVLLRSQAADRGHGEAAAAALAFDHHHGVFRTTWLRRSYGVGIPKRDLPRDLLDAVSWDAFDSLIAWTDHLAAETAMQPQERLRHLQDKVIFTLLRFPHWSAAALARLDAADVETIATDAPALDSWTASRHEHHALAWLAWHHAHIRPKLIGGNASGREFLSPRSGKALVATAIHMRFSTAVDRARLRSQIPRLTSYRQSVE